MATYKITDPESGKTVRVSGDHAPTQEDAAAIFSSMKDAPADSPLERAAAGAANAVGPDIAREVGPALAGIAGGIAGGPVFGIPLAGLMAAGARGWQNLGEAALGTRPLGSASQQAAELGRTALANSAGEGIGQGVGFAARALAPGATKVGAQIMRVTSGVPEKTGMQVLRDPAILGRANSLEEAGKLYAEGTGGLKAGVEGSRALFGKSYLNPEQAANAFDELWPLKDAMSPDEVLVLRQRMMKAVSEAPYKQTELKRVLSNNIDEIDRFLEGKLPDWSGARKTYREAKIADEFSSWLPQNKNMSPNVLRAWGAIGTGAAALAGTVNPLFAMAPLLASPRMWKYGIRGTAAASRAVAGLGNVGTRTALSYEANSGYIPIKP